MVFIISVESWILFCQTRAKLWVQIMNQNGTSPSESRHRYPPPELFINKGPTNQRKDGTMKVGYRKQSKEKSQDTINTRFLVAIPCNILLEMQPNVRSKLALGWRLSECSERTYDKACMLAAATHPPRYHCHPTAHGSELAYLCPENEMEKSTCNYNLLIKQDCTRLGFGLGGSAPFYFLKEGLDLFLFVWVMNQTNRTWSK